MLHDRYERDNISDPRGRHEMTRRDPSVGDGAVAAPLTDRGPMKLKRVLWSRTGRPVLEYVHASGSRIRYPLPERGLLTLLEASQALQVPLMRIYRMARRGEMKVHRRHGKTFVGTLELRRIRKKLKAAA